MEKNSDQFVLQTFQKWKLMLHKELKLICEKYTIVDLVYASLCQVHVCKMHKKEEQAETQAEKEEE